MPAALRLFRAARVLVPDASDAGPDADAIAVLGDRIVEVGDAADLRRRLPAAEEVDLDGALVVPGLNDAHCHPSVTAETRLRVDVSPASTPTLDDVRARLGERAASTAPGAWIVATGYAIPADGPRVDRAVLDAVAPDRPVLVVLAHLHFGVANSAALAQAGYDDDTADPVGGRLGRDAAGHLDGWLYEQAFLGPYFGRPGADPWVPAPDPDAAVDALVAEQDHLHALGLTSWCDAIVTPRSWRTYATARERGRLTARVGMLVWSPYLDAVRDLGLTAGFGDEHLRLVGIKAMVDGALSGGTCWCTEPYDGEEGRGHGLRLADPEAFPALVAEVHDAGQRAAVHANGDAAIAVTLDAIEAAQGAGPGTARHRIEHCSMPDAALVARLAAANVVAVPFGQFIGVHGERLVAFYGAERAAALLPHRALLDAGVTVAGSSDHPAGPVPPLLALQSLVTRTTAAGRVLGADQRLSVPEAIRVYTAGSAAATGEDHLKGTLAPGMLADLTVLDRDLRTVDPHTIADTGVVSTWVGGRCVWSA